MKIFFPIGSFFPAQCGGPSNIIYWLAKALGRQNGLTVEVVTTGREIPPEIPLNTFIDTEYGQVIYCRTRFHYFPLRMLFHSLKALHRCDVIHLTALFYPPSFILAFFAILLNKRVVWSIHGELDPEALRFQSWKKKPVLSFIKIFLKNKVVFHATSSEENEHIKINFGPLSSCILIPNGIEMPEKRIRNAKDDNPYFLFVGRLHPIKGLELLLNALNASNLFAEMPYRMIIAGKHNTPYGEQLKSIARKDIVLQNKVNFIGQIEGDYKEELYTNAHFLILPSFSENFGMVVVESLAQGTPVIASTGTPWEILPEKKAGFWVEPTIEGIRNGIENAIQMPLSTYAFFRDQSSQLAQQFDINLLVGQWVRVYRGEEANHLTN